MKFYEIPNLELLVCKYYCDIINFILLYSWFSSESFSGRMEG